MKLIGIAGKARSGKNTVGDILLSEYNYAPYALADPIRKAAAQIFGLPEYRFSGDNPNREEVDPYWGISPRQMLQRIGEGMRKSFGDDIWIRKANLRWDTLKADAYLDNAHMNLPYWHGMVVTDIRYDNEAQWVLHEGGVVIQIERPDAPSVSSHASERGIDPLLATFLIRNDGSLGALRGKALEIFKTIL